MEASDNRPLLDNPPLVAISNAYRRLHGVWPERARMTPIHFADMASSSSTAGLALLTTAMDLEVTTRETSPRVTVIGPAGELTYDDRVADEDWDDEAFVTWLREASDGSA